MSDIKPASRIEGLFLLAGRTIFKRVPKPIREWGWEQREWFELVIVFGTLIGSLFGTAAIGEHYRSRHPAAVQKASTPQPTPQPR